MNRTVLITGATGGIGSAVCKYYFKAGYNVCLLGRDASSLQKLINELRGTADQCALYRECDLTDRHQTDDAVRALWESSGVIDHVVHCAGVAFFKHFEKASEEAVETLFQTNTIGTYNLLRSVARHHNGRNPLRLVTVSTLAALSAFPFQSLYTASKVAADKLTSIFLNEQSANLISGLIVYSGRIRTDISSHLVEGSDPINQPSLRKGHTPMDPETLAEAMFNAAHTHKKTLVVGCTNWIFYWTARFCPAIVNFIIRLDFHRAKRIARI